MTDLIKTMALYLMKPECYDEYFINFNFFHGECMKATISKILGLLIVAGSLTVKLPQILKIIKSKNGEGISLTGNILELTSTISFFSYSYLRQYPFSSWGEGLFLAVQTAAVIGLILYFKKYLTHLVVFLSTFFTLLTCIFVGVIPISFFWLLQILNLPIIVLGKGVQALANYKNQSTGQLSAITCWMQFGGCAARVFTSFQETGDFAVILTFVLASVLNGIIVFQLLYYAKSEQKKGRGKGKSKGKKSD